jgi:hypothetical protein
MIDSTHVWAGDLTAVSIAIKRYSTDKESAHIIVTLLPMGKESERNPHPIFRAQGRDSRPVTIAC